MTGAALRPDHIALHAFTEDAEGNQEYTDDSSEATGWCVYNFHEGKHKDPDDPKWTGQIDIDEEADFATYEAALIEADKRAADYNVSVNEY